MLCGTWAGVAGTGRAGQTPLSLAGLGFIAARPSQGEPDVAPVHEEEPQGLSDTALEVLRAHFGCILLIIRGQLIFKRKQKPSKSTWVCWQELGAARSPGGAEGISFVCCW